MPDTGHKEPYARCHFDHEWSLNYKLWEDYHVTKPSHYLYQKSQPEQSHRCNTLPARFLSRYLVRYRHIGSHARAIDFVHAHAAR